MRKKILLGIGAWVFIVSAVIIALAAWALGLSSITRYSALPDDDKLNENIVVVEDSIEWKLLSVSRDKAPRISFKFALRNPTGEDVGLDVYQLDIRFFDAEGFALGRYNVTEDITIPANGEFVYTETHILIGSREEHLAYMEVLGVRSK